MLFCCVFTISSNFIFPAFRCMRAGSSYNDHGKRSICSHILSWISVMHILNLFSTSRVTMLCLCGESDSVFFPVNRRRKKQENKKQAALGIFSMAADVFFFCFFFEKCSIQWSAQSDPLAHTMTGIPWESTGFMFHHYLLMFGLVFPISYFTLSVNVHA